MFQVRGLLGLAAWIVGGYKQSGNGRELGKLGFDELKSLQLTQ